MRENLTKFIYDGWYYPTIGSASGFSDGTHIPIMDRRFGGWENCDKWWSFSYGLKCRLKNKDLPYKQEIIEVVNNHPEMNLVKEYHDAQDASLMSEADASYNDHFVIYSVYHIDGGYIGNIGDAYQISNLTELTDSSGQNEKTISCGWHEATQTAYGWSHRAIQGFNVNGSMIFEEDFGDENTPYSLHGRVLISNKKDALKSARRFAKSVS